MMLLALCYLNNKMIVPDLLLSAILLSHTANLGLSRTIDGGDGGDGCTGAIGSRPTSYSFAPQDTRTFNGVSGLFLNTRNKASCNGIVIAWDFCYYINFQQNTDTDVMLSFQAGVWKKKGGKYHMVNSTTIESSIPIQEKGFQFACQYQPLQENETFAVQEGDIVGTHMKDLDENLVPVLGTCGVTEPCCGLIRIDISNITSPIFESDFYDSSHSLYLMAIIGNYSANCTNSSIKMCPGSDSPIEFTLKEILLAIAVALLLFALLITILVVICCQLKRTCRTKASGPVLITTKLKNKNRVQQVENETAHESAAGTETEPRRNNTESGTDHGQGSPQQTIVYSPPLSSPPVLITHSTSASGDQSEMSPAPVVCAAAFDDGQSPSYDQDQILRKPVQHIPSMRAQKNVRFALRRSYSAAEALTLSHAGVTDTESLYTSTPLTDYPYVLHAFEVLGKDQAQARSLPNIHQFSEHYANLDFNPNPSTGMKAALAAGQDNQNHIQYTNIGTVNFNKLELDDELSYSYPNKRRLVRIFPYSLRHKISGDYSDDDHPLNWAPTSQPAKSLDSKLPVHKETNDILSPVKSQNTSRNKPKPPIPPRKKIVNQAAHRNDGANLGSRKPHKYTGLLSSTTESVHKYTYLQKEATELNELTTSDTDAERAYPNEWYN